MFAVFLEVVIAACVAAGAGEKIGEAAGNAEWAVETFVRENWNSTGSDTSLWDSSIS